MNSISMVDIVFYSWIDHYWNLMVAEMEELLMALTNRFSAYLEVSKKPVDGYLFPPPWNKNTIFFSFFRIY